MHDLVHDLALDVSQGNYLYLTSISIAGEQKYHPEVKGREEAEKSNILGKPNIHKLGLHWESDSESDIDELPLSTVDINHEDVLEGHKPLSNLKSLVVDNFKGRSFASWMMIRDARLLQNLVKIKLSNCTRCEEIPPLRHLPHLEVVNLAALLTLKSIGPEFYGHSIVINQDKAGIVSSSSSGAAATQAPAVVFPALRKLHLTHTPNLGEWSGPGVSLSSSYSSPDNTSDVEDWPVGGMSGLVRVKYLPDQLQHLTALRELTIEGFGGLEALLEWLGNISSFRSLELRGFGDRSLTI
ncbi:hypothetical protein HYC85_019825 [Camellia sinensis]|uniref:R13L1/DRL21-like LRR repeat region domain-containing protein n=1 Tax=Camellia sinensis TaxID=4442 RepID=A0A7J7GN23_CAMSI|nr:hypothetical protein HYC85_019825 [Camellia sinensis]